MGIDLDKLKGNKKEEEKEPKSDLESTKDDTKAAKAAIEFMNRRKKKAKAFEKEITEVSGNKSYQKIGEDENIVFYRICD
ncbi:hypothetical protein MHBO_001216 [Bonamia ostreae]|uniref:Uncharacterized protein n=1 Tax=Bonamia ostreae TaxID=126728 RepID=A0ABV2AI56_9EUKA